MKNVFVVGLDEHNLQILRRTPTGRHCEFHQLLTLDELQLGEVDINALLDKANRILDDFEGSVDAIVGYWDFPVTLFVPILCSSRGLPSASLESFVKCEHKYWSRLLQSEVIEEHPAFSLIDLEDDPRPPKSPGYPMWLKPVKSMSSELAYRVEDDEAFEEAVRLLREGVGRIGRPFQQILDRVDLPEEISSLSPYTALAEGALHGVQAAVEGYVYRGEVVVYGALDSVDYPGSPVFLRHQYPSALPEEVQRRMADVATRVIEKVGMDNATFSVEFFYDPVEEGLNVLEVNTRHSQSHAEIFELVDGIANHERMLRLAFGQDPRLPDDARGEFNVAAEWYYRRFDDGLTTRVPTPEEVAALEESLGGVTIEIVPEEGQRLSELKAQDSYSYELAKITIGAEDETEMRAKYERCVEELRFEFEEDDSVGKLTNY
ncbi:MULTISPECIES: ATP-grasp domain-containing protein [unclassified Nocardiopsis]|uniref:ATP-grasp domain-containing protein n=1 Tax=unclassified Nocardiopsis TaxID=2649073 RepID=UPI00135C440A|nr:MULTISPECIES: ATP-grasp domain-containing protein [unclassified Nocardiopsis]